MGDLFGDSQLFRLIGDVKQFIPSVKQFIPSVTSVTDTESFFPNSCLNKKIKEFLGGLNIVKFLKDINEKAKSILLSSTDTTPLYNIFIFNNFCDEYFNTFVEQVKRHQEKLLIDYILENFLIKNNESTSLFLTAQFITYLGICGTFYKLIEKYLAK
jgi:hypothetical protein